MSLKAKLEAVVYAAEEPVTLAQLSALFSEEVLAEMAAAAPPEPAAEVISESAVESAGDQSAGLWPAADAAADTPAAAVASQTEAALPARPGDQAEADSKASQAAAPNEEQAEKQAEKQAARLRERQARSGLKQILDSLIAEYAANDRGMEIREIAGGYRMATKPEYHDAVRGFVKSLKPPLKLSIPALETLAVVAYKQPVTAPEVSEIRGVDSGGVLGSLISRKLISTAGRKQVIGRPILYKTSKEFLLRFGLKDLGDLPSMEEFEKMAGELEAAEQEAENAPSSEDLAFEHSEVTADQQGEAPTESENPTGVADQAAVPEGPQAEVAQPESEPEHVSAGSGSDSES